jgi:peptidyl-prolyl cis-trans isomerase SurA
MRMRNRLYIKIAFVLLCIIKSSYATLANTLLVDKIVAKVGSQPILLSEVESIYMQLISQKDSFSTISKQEVLDRLIEAKLFVSQAKKEGAVVNEDMVSQELNNRIESLVDRLGSVSRVENYFGKSLYSIKNDFRKQIQEQILVEEVRQKVISNVQITPDEVASFFFSLPEFEIPIYTNEYVVYQFVKKVLPSEGKISNLKKVLLDYRSRVELGEDFAALIINKNYDYSSYLHFEELSWIIGSRNAPEYESQVVTLLPGTISQPIIGKKGVYLVKVISIESTKINVMHVFAPYNLHDVDLQYAKDSLLRIKNDFLAKKTSFEKEEFLSSPNIEIKIIKDETRYRLDDLPTDVFYAIEDNDMQEGDVSETLVCSEPDGTTEVKFIYLKNKISCHKASLENDYEKISDLCLNYKKAEVLQGCLEKVKKSTSVWIDEL